MVMRMRHQSWNEAAPNPYVRWCTEEERKKLLAEIPKYTPPNWTCPICQTEVQESQKDEHYAQCASQVLGKLKVLSELLQNAQSGTVVEPAIETIRPSAGDSVEPEDRKVRGRKKGKD